MESCVKILRNKACECDL